MDIMDVKDFIDMMNMTDMIYMIDMHVRHNSCNGHDAMEEVLVTRDRTLLPGQA